MRRRGNYQFLGKFSWYIPGYGGMFALLALMLAGALVGSLLAVLLGAVTGEGPLSEYGTLLSYCMMFVPPMMYAAVKSSRDSMTRDGVKLDSNNFKPLGGALCALLAAAGTLACGFWSDAISSLLPQMPDYLKEVMESMTKGNLFVNILSVSILAPICEEWLCRGMVLRGLLSRGSRPVVAIGVSALFFALIHLNPWQAIPAFLLGCLFGYVYYRTGSLKLTMLMHCVNNSFAIICSRIPALSEMDSWKDVLPTVNWAVLLAASILLTALVVLAFRKVQTPDGRPAFDKVPSIFSQDEV